jgi:hypothetical protein
LFVGEHCYRSAKIADKFTILRHPSHQNNSHRTGDHDLMTRYKPNIADGANSKIPNNELCPSIGTIISRELGGRGGVPPYINLPHPMAAGEPVFHGAEHAPFVIESDSVQPDFEVKDLQPFDKLTDTRYPRWQRLLQAVESDDNLDGKAATMAAYYDQARDHLMSCFPSLEKDLIPQADRAFSALVSDLHDRGMLDSTLVVMMGEMGRTPRINEKVSRDYWSMVQSELMASDGTKPGRVRGASDKTYHTSLGRPVPLVDGGKVIEELV